MGVLNAWQRLDRVLTGFPFGNGSAGSATISSDPNTRDTCTGTATSTTLTTGGSTFANGDVLLLHQTQGTGAGQWEINKVASGGGSTSLTLQIALNYSYATGAQAIKIPLYSTATVSAYTPTAWDGTKGGIDIVCAQTSATITGTINGNSGGFITHAYDWNAPPYCGGGTVGASAHQNTANGNGGGGGGNNNDYPSAGGGGNGTAGATGGAGASPGIGGAAVGSADLISLCLGGGGGDGGGFNNSNGSHGGQGANGGGVLIIITKNIISVSAVTLNGGTGGDSYSYNSGYNNGGGAGGAGGSCLIICQTATIGSNAITASAGSPGNSSGSKPGSPGAGGVGRISIHHSGTVTGTTSPTFDDTSEPTLVESLGGSFFLNLL